MVYLYLQAHSQWYRSIHRSIYLSIHYTFGRTVNGIRSIYRSTLSIDPLYTFRRTVNGIDLQSRAHANVSGRHYQDSIVALQVCGLVEVVDACWIAVFLKLDTTGGTRGRSRDDADCHSRVDHAVVIVSTNVYSHSRFDSIHDR